MTDCLLYHGSDVSVSVIDLSKSIPKKDFGMGFYTTKSKLQAENFAKIKSNRNKKTFGFVSVFEFTDNADLIVKKFETANIEWLNFVLENRGFGTKKDKNEYDYDMVIGPVADDSVGLVLNQLIIGTYGEPNSIEAKETAIRLLDTEKLHSQVLFRAPKSIKSLKFKENYRVKIN